MFDVVGKVGEGFNEELSTELRSKVWVGVDKGSFPAEGETVPGPMGRPLSDTGVSMTFHIPFFFTWFIYWMGNT